MCAVCTLCIVFYMYVLCCQFISLCYLSSTLEYNKHSINFELYSCVLSGDLWYMAHACIYAQFDTPLNKDTKPNCSIYMQWSLDK